MANSRQNVAFLQDKINFFKDPSLGKFQAKTVAVDLAVLDSRATNKEYRFLLENQKSLEAEFTQMFAVLKKQKGRNNEAFWMYSYYCASLLEAFSLAYSQKAKAEHYQDLKQQIKNRLENKVNPNDVSDKSFIQSLEKSFSDSFDNIKKTPWHLSQIRDYVGYTNLCRLYWIFCRLTLTAGLNLAKDLKFIEQLDAVLGTHTDVDKIISVFQAPTGILNYCSIGFFLGRLMIDGGLLVRHTFFPTKLERAAETTAYERFKFELNKRHCNFANDLVWSTVNFLTNFSHISHLPTYISGPLTAVFLGFDTSMLLYKNYLAKQEYLVKKEQYETELAKYDPAVESPGKYLLKQQLIELEIDYKNKEVTLYFYSAAAALLTLGFTAAILLTPPGMVVASFFVCTIAAAMYHSGGSFDNYQAKNLRLEHVKPADRDYAFALKEYQIARKNFAFTLLKNAIVPSVLITAFAICWPAAIALTLMYIGYELFHAHDQHHSKKEAALLALPERQDEVYDNGDTLRNLFN